MNASFVLFPALGRILGGAAFFLHAALAGAVAQEAKSAALPPLQELSAGVYAIGKMRLDKNAGTLTFPAKLQLESGFLEYLLVTVQGSSHESLLTTDIEPDMMHFAMLLLGAKGAGILTPASGSEPSGQIDAEYLKRAAKLQGDSLTISVSWQKDGKAATSRVEDWIFNKKTGKPAERGPWMYTGSMFSEGKFRAQLDGSFAAVVTNPAALINNPRAGNDDDQIWTVNEKAVPKADTLVEVTIRLEPGAEKAKAK